MISFVYFDVGGVVILDFSGTNKWEMVKKEWGITDAYWDVVIDSSVVGLAKQKAGVKGDEILFAENSPKNIDTAQSLGWQTFLYDPVHHEESSHKLLEFFFGQPGI